MITNPGPLRVTYSPDYLDWLYRAYRAKLKYADERKKAEEVFNGLLLTSQTDVQGSAAAATLPGAPPPGQTLRPRHSVRRQAGEARRAAAQAKLDALAQQQGMLDLFERQPQFPAIHIDKAARCHVVELFKEMVLDRAWKPEEVWDKALLYRAILAERQASYPASYRYILDTVEAVSLAPRESGSNATHTSSSSVGARSLTESSRVTVGESTLAIPREDDYVYFVYLVRRYYIDNAVEGHVVLRCHRHPNASELLFSHPPPKDEQEVLRNLYSPRTARATQSKAVSAETEDQAAAMSKQKLSTAATIARPRPPSSYPPIEALWRCAENEALLRVLVFGELNLLVSENPFVRFPNAQAYLTRPSSSTLAPGAAGSSVDGAEGYGGQQLQPRRGGGYRDAGSDGGISLSSVIAEKRGHLLAPLSRNVAMMIDSRANDVRRLQQRYEREDAAAFQKMLRGGVQAEENPSLYSAYSDWSYFNPRAVRAEERDALSRQTVAALKTYDQASRDIYRVGFEEAEANGAVRPVEGVNNAPSYVPTLPHFVALVKKDPCVSFLAHVALPEEYNSASAAATGVSEKHQLEKLVVQLARALYRTALEFHKQSLRRVNRQKVQVAASLLDRFVAERWRVYCVAHPSSEGVRDMAQRFSAYVPFEGRILDESGFPTDARVEDYERWMAAPSV
ncbi:conserved hypothetical protein [Leishmania braziliensis MHOM/BR/75/M2904]|uniref:Mitochondrial RNA binding complex 1 subunit n=2 Tax=Leishmania braziliensis TaxID=5660 RepID=A4HLW2_LEIBR|nr:conserved hypothetical protein [Leishmania braziliensis MHOM/BR/75/M2904]CAJ2479642.1 unnamed protein product [Leishmania braziliensis]CAM40810.1 conserved hypothetical protein [Leishmania braziliensis MHOM/BR/75/M2904]SYZ69220.1 mitochondrial_RNA_binding_complex_1_subunit [Leishmania braziliensis MHOM/BR/75/M2904]